MMAPSPDSDFQSGLHLCDNQMSDAVTRVQKECAAAGQIDSPTLEKLAASGGARSIVLCTSQPPVINSRGECSVTLVTSQTVGRLPQLVSQSLYGQIARRLQPPPPSSPAPDGGAKNGPVFPSGNPDTNPPKSIHSLFRFKPESKLQTYLQSRTNKKKDLYSLYEIMTEMTELMKADDMFDVGNPWVFLCSKELEEVLNSRGFHFTEFRELLLKHLVLVEERTEEPVSADSQTLSSVPPITEPNLTQLKSNQTLSSCSPGEPNLTELKSSVATSQNNGASSSTLHSTQKSMTVQGSDHSKPRHDHRIYSDKSARFKLKDKFRECLKELSDFDSSRVQFSYEEITAFLSKYILSKKNKLFDPRNIKLAIVKDDPLGEAFGVKAFHRCQVTSLLRSQIVYVDPKENSGIRTPPRTENERNVSVPPFPVITKAISMPAGSTLADTLCRKRSSSGDSADSLTVAKKSRRNGDSESEAPTEPEPAITESESDSETYEIEYDVDSGEEEKRPPQAGGGSGSSSDDSDVEELKIITHVVEEKEDIENWADSETEAGTAQDKDDQKLEYTDDKLECVRCKEYRSPHVKYCTSCWEARRNWTADRPRTKNMKKKKVRDNQRMARLSNEDETDGSQDSHVTEASSQKTTPDSEMSSQELEPSHRSTESGSSSIPTSSGPRGSVQSVDSGFSEPLIKPEIKLDRSLSLGEVEQKLFGSSSVPSLCMFCYQRPKNASLIHGRLGHQVCCYPCAKKLWKKQVRCPVCRRKIEKIVKIIMA